jgi:hypothetical protein
VTRSVGIALLAVVLGSALATAQTFTTDKCTLKKLKLADKKQAGLNKCFILRNNFGCTYNLGCCVSRVGERFLAKSLKLDEKYLPLGYCVGADDALTVENIIDANTRPPSALPGCPADPPC